MAVRIHLQFATARMRLARPISDANGRLVAGVGTMLSAGVLRVLRHMAVQSVVVDDAGELAPWERVRTLEEELEEIAARFDPEPETPPLAEVRHAIERLVARRHAAAATDGPTAEARES